MGKHVGMTQELKDKYLNMFWDYLEDCGLRRMILIFCAGLLICLLRFVLVLFLRLGFMSSGVCACLALPLALRGVC